ncbi:hypothetical protein Skr01_74640 [Sphaerisporangium krabiense]|nr:hypothetical protein Skr01_74640 [Sphaerisporangium krabiense]
MRTVARVPSVTIFEKRRPTTIRRPTPGEMLRTWAENKTIFYAIWMPKQFIEKQVTTRNLHPQLPSGASQVDVPYSTAYRATDMTMSAVSTGWASA